MSFQMNGIMDGYAKSYGYGENKNSNLNRGEEKKASFEKAMNDSMWGSKEAASYEKGINVTQKKTGNTTELSEKAQALLEELKSKYSNMDFFIANVSSDEEATAIMSQGTKEYSVLIDPETLEKMAEDEDFKKESLATLENSITQMKDFRDQLSDEEASQIDNFGFKINVDGTVDYFATLKENREAQKERIEQQKKVREEEKKSEEKKAEKDEKQEALIKKMQEKYRLANGDFLAMHKDQENSNKPRTAVLKANSSEELLEKIKNFSWDSVTEEQAAGINYQA